MVGIGISARRGYRNPYSALASSYRWEAAAGLIAWFTLLVMLQAPAFAGEYRIGHCLHGCPQGASPENHLILRPIYALSYNTTNKSADWVAYKISAGSIGIATSLSRQAQPDNYVAETLSEADFSSAEDAELQRAQFVALVDFAGTPYWDDVNYLTNAVARKRALNRGAWYGLEWSIRNLVNRGSDVFVLAGPVYKPTPQVSALRTRKSHRVPDAFFKIVITERGQGSVFLFDQNTPVHVHHCELRSTLAEIEALTGLDFFPQNPWLVLDSLGSLVGCRE